MNVKTATQNGTKMNKRGKNKNINIGLWLPEADLKAIDELVKERIEENRSIVIRKAIRKYLLTLVP